MVANSFGLSFWVYIDHIDQTGAFHSLFCKQLPAAGDEGEKLCLKFDMNSFVWVVGDSSLLNTYAIDDLFMVLPYIDTVVIADMVPQTGWQFLHFNIWEFTNVTSFEGYYFCDDETTAQRSYNATQMYTSIFNFIDDATYYLTVGARLTTLGTGDQYFNGII